MQKRKLIGLSLIFILMSTGLYSQKKILPYENTNLSVEERVNDLVCRMTLEEKILQMIYDAPAIERLGIPAYNWWNEALHGVARNGLATVFPQAIGLAATWDTDLMLRVSTIISDEARAKYNDAIKKNKRGIYQGLTFWSPNVNIFRDPRWGRGMETYGEDPYLTGQIGLSFVKGMQGTDPKYLKTITTAKHYAVHSGPEPGRHSFNTDVSDYDLRETYLPHFKTLVQDGNVQSIMCAYNRFRDEACCGSNILLNNILRNEWGFNGYVVSDCSAINDIYYSHKIVKTAAEASSLAISKGTDLECGDCYSSLVKNKDNSIDEEKINTAVKRLFRARFKLGMFDPPEMVPYSNISMDVVNSKSNQQAALEAARKSIVLLKNENNLLPLKKNYKTIAVIGPNANDVELLLGNYNGSPADPITPLVGIQQKLTNTKVVYERGCDLTDNFKSFQIIPDSVFFTDNSTEKKAGLIGEYFDNSEFRGKPVFKRIDKNINFNWGDGAPDVNSKADSFSVRWSGFIKPNKTGNYAIGGYGFNGFKIYIDDTLIVEFKNIHHPNKVFKNLNLQEGKVYKVKVEFYKNDRFAFMQLIWSIPEENLEQRAIEAAKKADAIIMVMGLSPRVEGEEMRVDFKGFKGGDRLTLDLPATQEDLLKKISGLNKPVVLVLLNGSALSINWEDKNIPAIIEAWYPGQAGGAAISDIIFGDYNPSGRLPVTFYKSVNQLPSFNDYSMSNRTYRYFKGEPLYPFGFGLSYTTFQYNNIKLEKDKIKKDESTKVFINITNTGNIKGEEVVQLYIKAMKDTKAIKTLKGFQRILLSPKQTEKVEFNITTDKLSRWIDDKGFSVEPDEYMIMVGSSSSDKDLKKISLKVE